MTAGEARSEVLVTGGCGFVGSHFIRHLLRTHSEMAVVNLDVLTYAGDPSNVSDVEQMYGSESGAPERRRYRFIQGDVRDRSLVDRLLRHEEGGSVRAIVHFAAESHVDRSIEDASPFIATNVLGTQVLLEAARSAWGRRAALDEGGDAPVFLHVSTDEIYGPPSGEEAFAEDAPLRPASPYAVSKASADLLCQSYAKTYGLPVRIARLSNQYGPNQLPEKLIPKAISSLLAGEPIPIYGEGEQRRCWSYVEDACRALDLLLTGGIDRGIYNIPGGSECRNIDLIREVIRIFDELSPENRPDVSEPERICFVPDPRGAAHDFGYRMDGRAIASAIGWRPTTSLDDGLRRTVSWYVAHVPWLRRALRRLSLAAFAG